MEKSQRTPGPLTPTPESPTVNIPGRIAEGVLPVKQELRSLETEEFVPCIHSFLRRSVVC